MISKKRFERNTDELQNIFNFLKLRWEEFHIDGIDQFKLELSVEEIFMNMIRHNHSEKAKEIEVTVEKKDREITLSLSDYEEVPFDITRAEGVDFDEYIKNKLSGGLGIHLVREVMDEVKFEHHQGMSTITIIKHI
jgi:serine/threonine-protein kinase RsbW